jgi:PHD/YefM family antitoxin component YafN of YafNO toxin-antitoxin module
METSSQPVSPEIEELLGQHGGPLVVPGQRGQYVMMRPDVYAAMLGMGDDEEAETLASVRRGLADLEAGRTQDLDEAFDELDARDGS